MTTVFKSNRTDRAWLVRLVTLLMAISLGVAGCETMTHEEQGEIIGGVLGGIAGAQVGDGSGQTVAIIVGTMAGAMIGRHIGRSMDDTDRMKTAQTLHSARTGTTTTWVNPDTGAEYRLTPTRTYDSGQRPCREFRLDATIGDVRDQQVHGTACLQEDGSWLIQ